IGQIEVGHPHAANVGFDIARLLVIGIARQADMQVLRLASPGQDRHAVEALLPVPGGAIADLLELPGREIRILALDFLEAGNIRLALVEPFEQPRHARANAVDVEAGDEHSGPLVCEFDYGATRQPTTDGPGGQMISAGAAVSDTETRSAA